MRLSATLLLLLTAVAGSLQAEDVAPAPPAPEPAPTAPDAPTSTTTSTATQEAAPAPAAAVPASEQAQATENGGVYVNPVRKARAKAARSGDQSQPWNFGTSVSAGYDSNILLESANSPTATNAKGLALGGDVRAGYKIIQGDTGRLTAGGSAEINHYPSEPAAQLIRYGGTVAASWSLGGFDPGVVLGYNKFLLDRKIVADATSLNAYVAKVGEHNVGILGGGSQYVDYVANEPATGTLYDLGYRHWFLLNPGDINTRIELGWKAVTFRANNQDFTYGGQVASLGGTWRNGPSRPEYGTIDVSGRGTFELRAYREPAAGGDGETQRILGVSAGADMWLSSWMSAGLYGGYTKRASSIDFNEYDRIQTGVRLAASW